MTADTAPEDTQYLYDIRATRTDAAGRMQRLSFTGGRSYVDSPAALSRGWIAGMRLSLTVALLRIVGSKIDAEIVALDT